ncbi:MAG: hypothetical protein ACRDTJ_07360 [Pseudonocardiaceae bacterium]
MGAVIDESTPSNAGHADNVAGNIPDQTDSEQTETEQAEVERGGVELRLWVSVNGGWSHFTVGFAGRDAVVDGRAVAWMDRVADRMSFEPLDPEGMDWSRFPRTYERLNPTCEHGLSAWLCMGPMHYPTREQEMAGEYF